MVTVTDVGLEYQARYTNQSTAGAWKWLGLGTGSTAEATSQTALVSEITTDGLQRALATLTYESSYKSVWTKTFTNTGVASYSVNECAVFDQLAVGGHMLMRHKFAATKTVGVGETLEVTMKLAQAV